MEKRDDEIYYYNEFYCFLPKFILFAIIVREKRNEINQLLQVTSNVCREYNNENLIPNDVFIEKFIKYIDCKNKPKPKREQ